MMKTASLSAAEIDRLVEEIGTLPPAPLAMPQQILESATPFSLRRALAALLHLRPASHQEM